MTEHIKQARELLKPSEVRLHHVPNWFRLAALKAFGGRSSGTAVAEHIGSLGESRWLDHWGSTIYNGKAAFVSEPYDVTEETTRIVAHIAAKCGCEWLLSANSWHFPGATIRILFYQGRQDGGL